MASRPTRDELEEKLAKVRTILTEAIAASKGPLPTHSADGKPIDPRFALAYQFGRLEGWIDNALREIGPAKEVDRV
jgi:hypothetical protein